MSPITSTCMASSVVSAARDLGARQHAPGELDRHLHLEGDLGAARGHGPPGPVDRRLRSEQVEDGLDEQQVDPALEQPEGLLLVGVAEVGVGDLAERRELGPRAHAAGHPDRAVGVEYSSATRTGQLRRPPG